MIIWITGNSGAGKTTLANQIDGPNVIHLDGDEMRSTISYDLKFSEGDRRTANLRVAYLAKHLEGQGFDVVVSLICPYRDLRQQVQDICGCVFLYLPGGKTGPEYPYETPVENSIRLASWSLL